MEKENDEGVLLEEALKLYSDAALSREYQELAPFRKFVWAIGEHYYETERDRKDRRFRKVRNQLQAGIKDKLRTGELVGTAYEYPMSVLSRRVMIPKEKWAYLELDFDQSSAKGHGLHLVEVRVVPPEEMKRIGTPWGRKPEVLSQREDILEAYEQMVHQGKVRFARGGLQEAALSLRDIFPAYKADSIRRIIQPSFKSQLPQKPSKNK